MPDGETFSGPRTELINLRRNCVGVIKALRLTIHISCSFVNSESRLRDLFVGDFGIFDSHDSHSHFHSHDLKIEYNNVNKARPQLNSKNQTWLYSAH